MDGLLETEYLEPRKSRDPSTGWVIVNLTSGPEENKHSYYDVSPWSPDGRELIFSSVAPETLTLRHRDNLASQESRVRVLDLRTLSVPTLAENSLYTTHTGTYASWHPSGDRVYFFRAPDVIEAVDRRSGRTVRQFPGSMRQLSPDGKRIVYVRRETGPEGPAGIHGLAEDGSRSECFASVADLEAITPNRAAFGAASMHLKNPKWSPDGSALLVANGIWTAPFVNAPGVARSLYLVFPETGEKRWLCHFGHHHGWTPDGRAILFCGKLETGEPRLFRADLSTGRTEAICDEPLEGHPTANCDGTLVATEDDDGIIIVDITKRKSTRVARYSRRFDKSHRGTHSHCVWSPDGGQLLYNSAETGASQLYLIDIP